MDQQQGEPARPSHDRALRFLLVTAGSRGDAEPFVALAAALRAAGHDPLLAGPARYRALAEAASVPYRGLNDSFLDLQDAVLAGRGTRRLRGMALAQGAYRHFLEDVADLRDVPTDHVVYHPKALVAPMLGEARGVPATAVQLVPLYRPTSAFPAPVTTMPIPGRLNRATWGLVAGVEGPWAGLVRRLRSERFGLAGRAPTVGELIATHGSLDAWSPTLLPAPSDWPRGAAPLGCWRSPAATWTPPAGLGEFLAEGAPPVYVGFGSMVSRDPSRLGAAVVGGIRAAGRRAVVARGAGAVTVEAADDVFLLDAAPHDWLFPQMAAVIHHGGVGTTTAALLAGVPQVIVPFFGDQGLWADQASRLGVANRVRRRDADTFGRAVERALDVQTAEARRVAPIVRAEDGLGRAVDRLTGPCGGA